ncbi:MAG: InlB B-repeat-containing protein, partial [Thermoplasmata archaeon]
ILQEPNGTYSYSIETIISGSTGIRYISSLSSGTITVDGFNITVNVSYTGQYYLKMLSNPSDGGNVSPQSGWYNAGSTITINAVPNSNFEFISWNGTGSGSYSGINNSSTITMNSPVTEQANFIELYSITFTESGLPSGTSWSVTLNGTTLSSTNSTITFQEPNGTYSYTIAPISGYRGNMYSGSITIDGNAITESIGWTVITYPITIKENGIPNGTSWSATITGIAFNGQHINVTLSS